MVGFLNAHGTSPCIFGGEFLDLSIVEDGDRAPRNQVGFKMTTLDDDLPLKPEPFDPRFNETEWSSMLLGADYDDRPNLDIAAWIQARYATEIALNDTIGYTPIQHVEQTTRSSDATPSFRGQTRTNVTKTQECLIRKNYRSDHLRGKAHRQPGGWKRYAQHLKY